MPPDVGAVTFDSYSTLVDVDAQERILAEEIDGLADPGAVSRVWRAQTMMYTVLANDLDAYRPFSELQALGLRYALERHGHRVGRERRERIRDAVYLERLRVFDDVRPALGRLRAAGFPLHVVSNGDPEMLEAMVDAAGIGELLGEVVSADEVRMYKPEAEIYRHAAARVGTPIRSVLHVSGGSMRDVWGAAHAGMRTAWVSRPEKRLPREHLVEVGPDLIVEDLHQLAARLLGPAGQS